MRLSAASLTLVVWSGLSALTLRVHAQDAASPPPAPPAATQSTESPADKAFAPVKMMMENLVQSLRNSGQIRPQDQNAMRFVRDKAADFSKAFPGDPRGLAIELQISMWLKEYDLVDDLFSRLAAARPDDDNIVLGQATFLINLNRYARAIEVLQARNFDPAKTPAAYVSLSDALFAEQKFKEAVDALKAIPASVLETDVFVKVQVDEALRRRENYEALWQAESAIRFAEVPRNDLPTAVIKTPRGEIFVDLFEDQAPNTVANFINLAEKGYYNGTKFHRVLPNFMAQGGDPNSRDGATGIPGQGGPGYYIPDEVNHPNARKHFTGTLAMAKTAAPNTGGSQFYLTVTPTPHLNDIHTVFGRATGNWDVIRALEPDDVIESIMITRKRDHPYEPTTLPLESTIPPPPTTQSISLEPVDVATDIAPPATAPAVEPTSEPAQTQPGTP